MSRDPLEVSPRNIWEYEQNKPSLVVEDLAQHGVDRHLTAMVLMARGVCKWLSVRRDLIKLKDAWKAEISHIQARITNKEIQRGSKEHIQLVARLKTLEECRKQVRLLAHSERWRVPDIDTKFEGYLKGG